MSTPKIVTMKTIGKHGRFANSIFQHFFLDAYARRHDCDLQLSAWVGNSIFGIRQTPVEVNLPIYSEPCVDGQPVPPKGDELVGHDFSGYGQVHTSYFDPEDKIQGQLVYRTGAGICWPLIATAYELAENDDTVIGIHLRRGDYGRMAFYVTPVEWYLKWLDDHWSTFKNPVLFIASEDPSLVDEFSEYNPVTTESLGISLENQPLDDYPYLKTDLRTKEPLQMDFMPDWYCLTQSDVLLIPNSTFSFTAAMFGKCKEMWRSNLSTQKFELTDPWNSYPLLQDVAEDYRHIPGVCLDETPYWKRTETGYIEKE